jgi:hypothetical protein
MGGVERGGVGLVGLGELGRKMDTWVCDEGEDGRGWDKGGLRNWSIELGSGV